MGVDWRESVVLRWDSANNCAALLEAGGIDVVWLESPDDRTAADCRAAGVQVLPADGIRLLKLDEAGRAQPGEATAIQAGTWPGAKAGSRGGGAFVAGATNRAWVDANGYLAGYLRALYPKVPPVLAYRPDKDAGIEDGRVIAYDSLELALVDAWCAGGNYILAPDAAYREALLKGNDRAMAAWKRMGVTARWLKKQRALFRAPLAPTITVLAEPGQGTLEIANLMYRQSASPDLVAADRLPAPDPSRRAIVVAAGLEKVSEALGKSLLAHARAGATVVTDACEEPAWWRVAGIRSTRQFEDREFYTLAAGRLVVYKEIITDPGDFAQDVLDLAGARRPVRMWDLSAGVAMASGSGPRSSTVRLVNYGSPARADVMVQVHGVFSSASLLRPEGEAAALRTYRRGGNTEVMVPALSRVAVVEFS